MDTAAYLKSQGWKGTGHSLDHTGRGISKPLPINQKRDLLGIGKPKTLVADQWWMRAFDSSLKELGSGKKTALHQVRETGINRGGLYGFFRRGESLQGTIEKDIAESAQAAPAVISAVEPRDASATSTDTTSTTASSASGGNYTPPTTDSEVDTMARTKSSKKRKAENETAPEVRKRRKEERDDTGRTNAVENHQTAVKKGTFDWNSEEGKRKMVEVNKRVKQEIEKMEAEGRFGEIPPDSQEAAAKSRRESMSNMGINPERLAFIQSGAAFPQGPRETKFEKKASYKAEKYKREKAMREAKREIKDRIMAEMALQSTRVPAPKKPVEDKPSEEELQTKEKAEKEAIKTKEKEEKEAKKVAKAAKSEAAQAELAEKEAAKEARRQAKKDRKAQEALDKAENARRIAEQNVDKTARLAEGAKQTNGESTNSKSQADGFAEEGDEISLGDEKNTPGAGTVDKSSKKRDKKQKKLKAQALEVGLTVEEYLQNQKQKKEQKAAQTNGNAEMTDDGVPLTNGNHVTEDALPTVDMLSDKKKEKYAARAAEKGVTLEAYLARRVQKKVAAGIPIAAPAPSKGEVEEAKRIAKKEKKEKSNKIIRRKRKEEEVKKAAA